MNVQKSELKKRIICSILVAVSFCVLLISLFRNQLLNIRYRLIVFFVSVIIAMVILILTKKNRWRVFTSVLLLLVSGSVYYAQNELSNIMSEKQIEVVQYDLIVRKGEKVDEKTIFGEIGQAHTKNEYALKAYQSLGYQNNQVMYYQDVDGLVDALFRGEIQAMMVDHQFMVDFERIVFDFNERVDVVKTFYNEIEREVIVKNVDINRQPYIVYVSGIDVYGSTTTRSRSDLNLLLVVNPQTKQILNVSIPRDAYVDLSCKENKKDKLTHAALYGVDCSVKTLEQLFDIDINYFVRVNFTSLEHVIDALGGVDVNSHYTFKTDSGYSFVEGLNQVNGKEALAFARERVHIDYGDVSRGIHHQELIEAIFKKVMHEGHINTLPSLIQSLYNVLDTNFGYDNFARLISNQIDSNDSWRFDNVLVEGEGAMDYTYSQGNQFKYYVYRLNQKSVQEVQSRIKSVVGE